MKFYALPKQTKYNDTDTLISQRAIVLLNLILNQNYFHYCNKLLKLNKGVGTECYAAGIIGKIFIRYFEQLVSNLCLKQKVQLIVVGVFVDILIIFNSSIITKKQKINTMNIHSTLAYMNIRKK